MQTREKVFGISCPACGQSFENTLNTAIFANTGDREELLANKFAEQTCPSCGHNFILNYRFVYTDEDIKFMLVNDPKFVDMKARLAFKSSLAMLDRSRKDEQDKFLTRMTTDMDEVREKILIFEDYLSDKAIEVMKYMLLESDELMLNHDDVESMRYTGNNSFYILTTSGEEFELGFIREVYDTIADNYEGMFDSDQAEKVDRAWAYNFLKNVK